MAKKKNNPNKIYKIPVKGILLVMFLSVLATVILVYIENKKHSDKIDKHLNQKYTPKKTKVKKLYEVPHLDKR